MNKYLVTFILFLCLFIGVAQAKIELHQFENNQQQQLYKKLSEQLRCLVCQNQNLADSNAELAKDMRKKTYQMVVENQSEQQILDYWVERYGDFVLYNPPFKAQTLILWLGPFVFLLLAIFIAYRLVKASKQKEQSAEELQVDEQAHAAARDLLEK